MIMPSVPNPDNKPEPEYATAARREQFLMRHKRGRFPVFTLPGLKPSEAVFLAFCIRLSERRISLVDKYGKWRAYFAKRGWYLCTAGFVGEYLGLDPEQQCLLINKLKAKGLISCRRFIRGGRFKSKLPQRFIQLHLPGADEPQTPAKVREWINSSIKNGSWWNFRPKLAKLYWPPDHPEKIKQGKAVSFLQTAIIQCLYDQSYAHRDEKEREACWSRNFLQHKLGLNSKQQKYHLGILEVAGLVKRAEVGMRETRVIQFDVKRLIRCLAHNRGISLWGQNEK